MSQDQETQTETVQGMEQGTQTDVNMSQSEEQVYKVTIKPATEEQQGQQATQTEFVQIVDGSSQTIQIQPMQSEPMQSQAMQSQPMQGQLMTMEQFLNCAHFVEIDQKYGLPLGQFGVFRCQYA